MLHLELSHLPFILFPRITSVSTFPSSSSHALPSLLCPFYPPRWFSFPTRTLILFSSIPAWSLSRQTSYLITVLPSSSFISFTYPPWLFRLCNWSNIRLFFRVHSNHLCIELYLIFWLSFPYFQFPWKSLSSILVVSYIFSIINLEISMAKLVQTVSNFLLRS